MKLGDRDYEGPFHSPEALKNRPGVYAVLGRVRWSHRWEVLDIGAAERVADAVLNHSRLPEWQQYSGVLGYCVHYCDGEDHGRIVREMMHWYAPPLYASMAVFSMANQPGAAVRDYG